LKKEGKWKDDRRKKERKAINEKQYGNERTGKKKIDGRKNDEEWKTYRNLEPGDIPLPCNASGRQAIQQATLFIRDAKAEVDEAAPPCLQFTAQVTRVTSVAEKLPTERGALKRQQRETRS
jgi:hypothetical protein